MSHHVWFGQNYPCEAEVGTVLHHSVALYEGPQRADHADWTPPLGRTAPSIHAYIHFAHLKAPLICFWVHAAEHACPTCCCRSAAHRRPVQLLWALRLHHEPLHQQVWGM